AGAAVVVLWTFSQTVLTTDNEPLAARATAGHELGWILLAVMLACAAAGLAVRFATLRNPPSAVARERAGRALLCALALVPLVAIVGLAASSRGLFGSISHDFDTLTNTNIGVTNSADRLTALGSQRALYWSDALKIFDEHPLIGSGAGSFETTFLRFEQSNSTAVAQAHSYIFQTLADLGLIGLGLSLLLAGAWIAAALRASGPLRLRAGPAGDGAERIGLLALVASILIFTVHSTVDWTWFIPGVAMIAMLLAGWVAGRGPTAAASGLGRPSPQSLRDPLVALVAAAVVALTLLLAWSAWQPLRSSDASNSALNALVAGKNAHSPATAATDFRAAAADARAGAGEDPLDYVPLVWLAYAQADLHPHDLRVAYRTIVRAIELQPANYQAWYDLAEFDWSVLGQASPALSALGRSLYLYPQYSYAQSLYERLLPAATPTKRRGGGKR
ncbi:MAG TPA: O-antigen ligase family protein, partial [Solirubrobacteraceae bacterium]|nr:O-antigen ligase family protein [Solirubrobacteraceae bacterium]